MRWRRLAMATVVTLAAGGAGASCGSDGNTDGGGSGTGGKGGIEAGLMDVNTSNDAPYDGPVCGGATFQGQTWPLDLFVMMDQSGSMMAKIDQAKTIAKWQAVTTGLSSYFQAEASAGDNIGVGIQFFPLPVVPVSSLATCSTTADCSGADMCLTTGEQKFCVKPCTSSAECGGAECVDAGAMICANDSCTVADYSTPEVAIGPVGSTKDAVLASMAAHKPMMYTPTGPALEGALQYAKSYQQGHQDRKVIVVLATDGQPTECPATDTEAQLVDKVKGIAAAGLAGTPSVRTFVVGVVQFGDTQAVTNLHAIAAAGGTTEALIAEPKEDLAKAFTDALVKITGEALTCDYKIPLADGGKPDFNKVNVVVKINGGADQVIYHVADKTKCDPVQGGWYYDPPAGEPESIKLCGATCAMLNKSGQTVEVGFEIGCATQNMPPK